MRVRIEVRGGWKPDDTERIKDALGDIRHMHYVDGHHFYEAHVDPDSETGVAVDLQGDFEFELPDGRKATVYEAK